MRHIVLAILIAAACRAEDACPFLNAATAAGVLGGEVISHYDGSTCLFTHAAATVPGRDREGAVFASQLLIKVQTVTLPYKLVCEPNPTSLKAIGNEAVICSMEGKNGSISEQIAGRVRDRAFFIRLTSNNIPRDALREKARSVAEQVAGILF
jgi:hypothetical protein